MNFNISDLANSLSGDASLPASGAAASGGAPSSGDGMDNLAYFLAMMGKGIDPKGFGGIVGEDVQGQVRTNKFANLLKKNQGNDSIAQLVAMALGGGGKVNIDPEKTTVNLPHDALPGSETPVSAKGNTLADRLANPGGIDISPFLSGPREPLLNFDSGDLVGLTPADLTAVMEMKGRDQDRTIGALKDAVGLKYQMGLIDNMEADNQLAWYNALTKDDRTEMQKNYDAAVKDGSFKGGFMDFMDAVKNDSRRDYEFAVSQGYNGKYKDWVMEMKKAGALNLNLGGLRDKLETTEQVQSEAKLTAPGFMESIEKASRQAVKDEEDMDLEGAAKPQLDKDGRPLPQLNTEEKVKLKTIQSFTDQAESVYGPGKVELKVDKTKKKAYWYAGKKLIRSYTYGN